jgi:hypothetical protein
MHRLAVVLAAVLACAHSPEPPPGPRPLTGKFQIQRNDAGAVLETRYQAAGRELEVLAVLRGSGTGSVGPVRVELKPTGLVLEGDPVWTGEAAGGQEATHTWRLRPEADGVARVEIVYSAAEGALEGGATAGFRVTSDAIRLCGTADCAGEDP